MNTSGLLLIVILVLLPSLACREGPSASSAKQIATDLPDSGTLTPVHVYWITGNRLFRAACPDRNFILREHCQDGRRSIDYARFKRDLDGGLSETIRQLTDETNQIQSAIRAVEQQIVATTEAIADLERRSGHLSAEVGRLRDDIRRFDAYIREYREQLALIEAALRRLADADLAAQRNDMLRELARCQQSIADIARQVDLIMDQIRAIGGDIGRLRGELTSLTNRATNLRYDLSLVAARLQQAYDDFSVYEETLVMLNDEIIFRVLSDNVRFQKVRQFVRRFERIFAANPE